MKIKLDKNKQFLHTFCKIIKKNNCTILLVNYDKLEFLTKYKNIHKIFDKTIMNKRLTYLILKLVYYKVLKIND